MKQTEKTIKLDQFLKFKHVVGSGGQAKQLVQYGHVQVNGEVETRRGRKLRTGDTVTVDDRTLTVDLGKSESAGDAATDAPAAGTGQDTDDSEPTPVRTARDATFWEDPDRVTRFADREPDRRLVALLEEYAEPAAVPVLDLGCAGGRNTELLAARGFDVVALDASQAMVARTRARVAEILGPEEAERRVRLGRMDDLSWAEEESIALIVAFGVYHEARDDDEWERAQFHSMRVLRPGGRLLLATLSPGTIMDGEMLTQVPGTRLVHRSSTGIVKCLVAPNALDAEMAVRGLRPEVPTETLTRDREDGQRVVVNALYVKA